MKGKVNAKGGIENIQENPRFMRELNGFERSQGPNRSKNQRSMLPKEEKRTMKALRKELHRAWTRPLRTTFCSSRADLSYTKES